MRVDLTRGHQRDFGAGIQHFLDNQLAGEHLDYACVAVHVHTHILRGIEVAFIA
ncbi:hypothetical protein D3C86_1784370 [compost metagenome]